MSLRGLLFIASFALPLAACGAEDAPAADAPDAGSEAPAAAAGANGGPITAEAIRSQRLSLEQLEQWAAAQEAYLEKIEADPALLARELERRRQMDAQEGAEGQEAQEMLANVQEYAPIREILREHGFSPQEFVLVTVAFVNTGVAVAAPNSGMDAETNAHNLELFRSNPERIQQISARMQAVNDRFDELEQAHAGEEGGEY